MYSISPSTTSSNTKSLAHKACFSCGHAHEHAAKFCGQCGNNVASSTGQLIPLPGATLPNLEAPVQTAQTARDFRHPENHIIHPPVTQILVPEMPHTHAPERLQVAVSDQSVPSFAHVAAPTSVDPLLRVEAGKLLVLLARERLFLLLHWALFISVNVIGFVLSFKCYTEFIGDEMSKLMMGMTPFWLFNAVALACIIPIKGTRREIVRLKERLSFIKFKIDYGHLVK